MKHDTSPPNSAALPRWRQIAAENAALLAPAEDDIPFTPVPAKRNRASGWTQERQRGFIRQL